MSIIRSITPAKSAFQLDGNSTSCKLSETELQDIRNASTVYSVEANYKDNQIDSSLRTFREQGRAQELENTIRDHATTDAISNLTLSKNSGLEQVADNDLINKVPQEKAPLFEKGSYFSAADATSPFQESQKTERSVSIYERPEEPSLFNTEKKLEEVGKNYELFLDEPSSFHTKKENSLNVALKTEDLAAGITLPKNSSSVGNKEDFKELGKIFSSHEGRADLVMGGVSTPLQPITSLWEGNGSNISISALSSSQGMEANINDPLSLASSNPEKAMTKEPSLLQGEKLSLKPLPDLIDKTDRGIINQVLEEGNSLFKESDKVVSQKKDIINTASMNIAAQGNAIESSQGASSGMLNTTTSIPPVVATAIRASHLIDELTSAVTKLKRNNTAGNDITIQLRSDVLPETSIHINATSKQLEVAFQTGNAASNLLLNTHLASLQSHLASISPGQLVTITTQLTPVRNNSNFDNQTDSSNNDLASFDQGNRRNSNNDNNSL